VRDELVVIGRLVAGLFCDKARDVIHTCVRFV